MKISRFEALLFAGVLLFYSGPLSASGQPPMRGPLPPEQRDIIQYMAEHHKELTRDVQMRDDGYEATTTTENPELAHKLKQHFTYMEKRLGSGAMIRRWDPAFEELVRHKDLITTEVEMKENGIRVLVRGSTPEGVRIAQNHAQIVTGFTQKGQEAVRQKHEAVLRKEKPSTPVPAQTDDDNGS